MQITTKANAAYTAPIGRVVLGRVKGSREIIYLTLPEFECDWYWAFGYLGNKNCFYHLGGYANGRNINMYDALLADYDLSDLVKDNLWTFCELVKTCYTFIEIAGIVNRGGSHYTKNPCKELIKNPEMYDHITYTILPTMFKEIDKLFGLEAACPE